MTIIYLLSPTGIDITKKCLEHYLQHLKVSSSVFSLTTNYSEQINKEYLKLILPDDVTNPDFYAGLRHRADHHHFDFSANLRTYRVRELLPLIWIPPLLKRKALMK